MKAASDGGGPLRQRQVIPYAWKVVGLLWVVAVLNYLDRQVIFTLFPLLQHELALSYTQLGLLGTGFLWIYALLSPFCGYLADRYSRSRIVILSLLVWSVVTYATSYAQSFPQLLATRALMGISEACYVPAALAMIADYHDGTTRSLATGIHQSGLYIGITLGGVAGGWIGQQHGWRSVFTYMGAAGILYSAVLTGLLRQSVPNSKEAADRPEFLPALLDLSRMRAFRLFILAGSLGAAAYWAIYAWLPTFLYERFRMSVVDAGFSATVYIQVASVAGILIGGVVADRWSSFNDRGRLLTAAIGFALAAPAMFLVGTADSKVTLICGLVLFGIGRGFIDCNIMPILCQIAKPQLWATGYGVINLANCISGGLMSLVAGMAKDQFGLDFAFRVSAVLLAAPVFLLVSIKLAAKSSPCISNTPRPER
jgi:MFS transporter, Spinster family, sphingosine-1-phosphate transporter